MFAQLKDTKKLSYQGADLSFFYSQFPLRLHSFNHPTLLCFCNSHGFGATELLTCLDPLDL